MKDLTHATPEKPMPHRSYLRMRKPDWRAIKCGVWSAAGVIVLQGQTRICHT